jgi:hypothetical protein
LMPEIGLKEVESRCVEGELAAKWTILVGKGASDGGSVDVDFGDDTLYGYYTLQAEDSTTGIARGYIEVGQAKLAPILTSTLLRRSHAQRAVTCRIEPKP